MENSSCVSAPTWLVQPPHPCAAGTRSWVLRWKAKLRPSLIAPRVRPPLGAPKTPAAHPASRAEGTRERIGGRDRDMPPLLPLKAMHTPSSLLQNSQHRDTFFLPGFLRAVANSQAAGGVICRGIRPGKEKFKQPVAGDSSNHGCPAASLLPAQRGLLPALRKAAIKSPHQLSGFLKNGEIAAQITPSGKLGSPASLQSPSAAQSHESRPSFPISDPAAACSALGSVWNFSHCRKLRR